MIISAMMNSSARGGGTDGCCTTLLLVLEARHLLLADGYDMSTHTVSAEIADPLASFCLNSATSGMTLDI